MNPDRWQEIDKLLSEALKREPSQREDFLERACAGDEELRKQVDVLLEARDRAGSFMEKPALEALAFSSPPSLIGGKLGPFEILSLLGRGGMGEVYKVRDTRLDRINALKILPPDVARDPDRLRRFIREAKAASALNHPNIATIHEIGESDGIHWIAMELVEGQTLAERIKDRQMKTDEILDIGIQAAEALAEAHSKGIIHRDIKPANLMLTPKGVLKILDFGLAKKERRESLATGADTTETHTVPGLVMGTARYMSPEQVLGQSVDHRTDIFSLGVVLYEMAAGQPPFRGDSPSAILDAIVHQTPAWPPRVQDMVPEELRRIISEALEKFREVRYDAASELSADLKRLKRDSESGKSAASPALTRPTLPRPRMKLWLGIAGMLAIIAVPLGWYLFRERADTISEPLRIVPFTSLPGIEAAPRFSPDGKFVAFQWNGPTEDNWDIYVKQVAHGEEPFRLTRDPAADRFPVWSLDGGEIAFVRVSGETTSIYTLPFPQGAERRLYELRVPSLASDLSWSPDGRLLAFSEKSAAKSPARIYLLSPDTQQTTPLTSPPPGIDGDFSPEFSPDGKRLAFARRTGYAVRDIWIQPLPSGEATRLTHESYTDISRPTWAANGKEVVFAGGDNKEAFYLVRIPIAGGVPQPVVGIGENANQPAIWRNYMVFSQWSVYRQGLWRIRGPSHKGKDRSPAPVLPSTRQDWFPAYSPDGKRLAFSSTRSGFAEIWICNSDGTKPVQLTNLRKRSNIPRWFPNGRQILFGADGSYVIDADGGIPQRLDKETADGWAWTWSRDGRWTYFTSGVSGRSQVWKMPSEGGKAVQITRGGAENAMESFDGKMLYYVKTGRRNDEFGPIWKIPIKGGEETPVLEQDIGWMDWALRPEGIYFATQTGRKYSIELLSFQTGKITPFHQEETPNYRLMLAISPDGEWFVYTEYIRPESDLMLVENFR